MRIFEIVKENVNLRETAELYGIDVNRYGKALCPFHNDRNPSLYVADDHFYCFACGAHGDVIGFAANFFGLPIDRYPIPFRSFPAVHAIFDVLKKVHAVSSVK